MKNLLHGVLKQQIFPFLECAEQSVCFYNGGSRDSNPGHKGPVKGLFVQFWGQSYKTNFGLNYIKIVTSKFEVRFSILM